MDSVLRAARGARGQKSTILECRTREELTFLSPQDEYLRFRHFTNGQYPIHHFIYLGFSGEVFNHFDRSPRDRTYIDLYREAIFDDRSLGVRCDADEYNENVWLSGSCKAVVTVPC